MTINQERFPTYKPLSPVLRTQTTYAFPSRSKNLGVNNPSV